MSLISSVRIDPLWYYCKPHCRASTFKRSPEVLGRCWYDGSTWTIFLPALGSARDRRVLSSGALSPRCGHYEPTRESLCF
jgi:hypothetical protein